MIRWFLILVSTLILQLNLNAETPSTFKAEPPRHLAELARKHNIESQHINLAIQQIGATETRSPHPLSFQEQVLTFPASVMKLPSCLFALETLGGDYRFSTRLIARGRVQQGKLIGDIYLIGGLDPLLTATRLFDFALALQTQGIRSLEGRFIIDDSLFSSTESVARLGAMDQTYNSGIGALSVEFNRFRLINRARPRERADFLTIPPIDYLALRPTEVPMAPRQRFRAIESSDSELWEYSRTQSYSQQEELPVKDPTGYTGELFRHFARQLGIELPAPTRLAYQSKRGDRLLHELKSPELVSLCESSLEFSNNMVAEHILLKAALKVNPQITRLEQAGEVLKQWIVTQFPQAGFDKATFANGSGLSLETKMSAHSLTQLLAERSSKTYNGRSLMGLVSLGGQSGWIRNRFHHPELAFRVLAKTGSLDFVSNIAGYLLKDGDVYAFSLFIADHERRIELEHSTEASRVRQLTQEATGFRNRSQALADELLLEVMRRL
jgi:serine-type D-Ala-D-Ala carboxypeptidase/endopeptidase (penicillin-binding protein 4)